MEDLGNKKKIIVRIIIKKKHAPFLDNSTIIIISYFNGGKEIGFMI
jgi:hypothetical protein